MNRAKKIEVKTPRGWQTITPHALKMSLERIKYE